MLQIRVSRIVLNLLGLQLTFQQPFDLPQLRRIIQLPEILGFLCQVFALDSGIPLILNDFGCCIVQVWDHRSEVNICRTVSR